MNSVIGYYTTQFGELWEKSLFDLVEEAVWGVLHNTGLKKEQIDAIFFGNMLGGVLENNLHSSAKIAELLDIHVPVFRTEAACASGGTAFYLANNYLHAGAGKTVLIIGAEKMNDFSPEEVTAALAAAASGEEQETGLTFPGLYAMLAQYYLQKYRYTEEHLAHIPVKNHYHGSLNSNAHFKRHISLGDVLKSPYVASPIKVLDSSPISDGASAVILTNDKALMKSVEKYTTVLSCETATDSISLAGRNRLDEIIATKIAGEKAFDRAKIKRSDIHVAELHDCFSIAEILAMEDLGFWKKGEGGKRAQEGTNTHGSGGDLITNTSGGLKAAGHPVGATGIKQIGELFLQLTGQAGKRQVKSAHYGLAHNVGGSGGTAVVTIVSS